MGDLLSQFYRKGNYGRLFFSIIVAVYGVIRYIIIMNYGDLSDLMTLMLTLNGQSVTLNIGMMFTGALIVAIVLRLLKVPKEYGSYKDEREDFIESKRDKERMQIFFEWSISPPFQGGYGSTLRYKHILI